MAEDRKNRDFTSLDFEEIKADIISSFKSRTEFRDWNFTGSNINLLMDILASNTFQNNVYNNMLFSEMFLDSSQLRENAMSHSKDLGYIPRSRKSSMAFVDLRVNAVDLPINTIIPRGAKFKATCGDKNYIFVTDKQYNVIPSAEGYVIRDIPVYEGREVQQTYTVSGNVNQSFTIPDENVDISSVRVFVRANQNSASQTDEYAYKEGIFEVESDDLVFYIEPDYDNFYKVTFGRNIFGRQPVENNVVTIIYRSCKGEAANGANTFTANTRMGGYPVTVIGETVAGGGRERESLQDIKFFAPRSAQVQERAITKKDYEILLMQRFPQIQAVSVYGGDEVDPPQYGKVIISVDLFGSFGAGEREIALFKEYITSKSALTIEPIFVPAEFLWLDLDIKVKYNQRLTSQSEGELQQIIKDTILNYGENSLSKFGSTFLQSRLAHEIDSSNISFISTDITAKPIIDYTPPLNTITNPSFSFNGTLVKPYDYVENIGFEDYKPAITTTPITYNNTLVVLQDDGNGRVFAATASANNRRIFRRNVGSIDYEKGIVTLSNFAIQGYQGNEIKFIANTVDKDVQAPKNRILAIREQDIRITVKAV
jgi:hypothetical protein